MPAPHKNHPGDHWREDKRPNAVSSHHDAHDQTAAFVKPPRDQRGGGQKERTASGGGDEPVPEIEPFDRGHRAGHVDAETMHQGAQEKDETYTMGVKKRSNDQHANAGHHRGEGIRKRQSAM